MKVQLMILRQKGVITMAFVMSMLSLLAAIVAYVGYGISQKAVCRSEKIEQATRTEKHEVVTSK